MKLKFANALSLALIMAMLFTSVGLADNLQGDDLNANGNATKYPGQTGTAQFYLVANGSDGCNADASNPVTVTISSSQAWLTIGSSVTLTGCGAANAATITYSVASNAPINGVSIVSGVAAGGKAGNNGFNNNPGDFTVTVIPSPNTAPSVSVTGVSNGGSYSKGSVPAAICSVTDIDDGNSTLAASLSAITGPYANDGIGSQTASCSYTDAGGLTANASATYSIVDPSAPSISYVLNAASPDGNNGWYKSNVTLTWTVNEPESPNSLTKTGCVDQSITADQGATTYSCSALSAGGAASQVNVTIKRDATAPVITFVSPSTSSWYNADVSANWSCTDALSGAVNASVTATASGEGSAVPATGTCMDNAGNTQSDTQSFMIDKTGPSITASATKADTTAYAADAWTNQDVTVDFVCSDAGSGVASCLGDASYSTEGIFTASGMATDNVGNSSNASFGPIKIDKTAPTITGAPTASANSNGWYNGDVTIHWTCSDGLSGLSGSCPADSVITGEGDNLSASASVSDAAGNSASATVSGIKIDRTAPTASATASPSANSNGWNNSDVTVSFSGADALSGIESCSADQVFGEGANQTASGTCVDKAGNVSNPTTVTINVDKTVPTISGAATTSPNGNGWYSGDVAIHWTCSDALSGLDGSCPADSTITGEGNNLSANASVSDLAGNSANTTVSGIQIDRTAPSVSLVGGPANGGTYYFGLVPAAPTCSASDALSGIDGACSVSGYSTTLGAHTLSANATDKAGNSASASASYTVAAWTLKGFYQPVDMGIVNNVKAGSTVPLKFEVFAGPMELTNTSIVSAFTQKISCASGTGDDIEQYATGTTSLRYDTTGGQFIFNWQTPKSAGACYRVTLTTSDGSSIFADFRLK